MSRGDKPRYFNGVVSRFSQMGTESRFARLPRRRSCLNSGRPPAPIRAVFFKKLNVPDILKKGAPVGLELEWAITGAFQPREYCVQYRETDFNFASRLMEEEGIYYFFKHANGSHKMVICNNPGAHSLLLPDYGTVSLPPLYGPAHGLGIHLRLGPGQGAPPSDVHPHRLRFRESAQEPVVALP